jgi:hypothetical protein
MSGYKMDYKTKNKTEVGKIFEIGERTFYSIVQISTVDMKNSFSESISPVALVVVEPSKKYILPLTEEEVDTEKIINLVFSE